MKRRADLDLTATFPAWRKTLESVVHRKLSRKWRQGDLTAHSGSACIAHWRMLSIRPLNWNCCLLFVYFVLLHSSLACNTARYTQEISKMYHRQEMELSFLPKCFISVCPRGKHTLWISRFKKALAIRDKKVCKTRPLPPKSVCQYYWILLDERPTYTNERTKPRDQSHLLAGPWNTKIKTRWETVPGCSIVLLKPGNKAKMYRGKGYKSRLHAAKYSFSVTGRQHKPMV